jgi:hypothetical protein
MKAWAALLFTFGLIVLSGVVTEITHINITLLMILGTSLWVAIDSRKIELLKYKSGISYGPIVLFFACVFLWLLGFPWYLIVRNKIKTGVAVLKNEAGTVTT